jgi:2-(1,2-epoxy-1,2-dihydrophenyl)acetyl-CoA isomerase
MNAASALLFERRGAIAFLTMNRPTVGNAIDLSLAHALLDASINCDEDDAIRCVVLGGAGRLFCVGGDVSEFAQAGTAVASHLRRLTDQVHIAITRLLHMQKPLVTAINGPAAGAGVSLAILGDFAIAARSAHFSLAYTALGLTPDAGATWLLPRLVGLRRAQELILSPRRSTAEEAASMGLITRAVEDTDLTDEVEALAGQLASSATPALGRSRALLLSSFHQSLEAQLGSEARAIIESSQTREGREGIAAFLAKRKPEFSR